MIAVHMVQAAVMDEVEMIAVLHHRVRVRGAVMAMGAVVDGRLARRVCVRQGEDVFVRMIAVHMVKMAVMEIVHVPVMDDRRMPAIRRMGVGVAVVDRRMGEGRAAEDDGRGRRQKKRFHDLASI